MSHAGHEGRATATGEAGFTLLEVLAAVAIAGFVLSAVGSIVAVTLAGVRSTADRVALTEVGRTLLGSLPQGEALRPGSTTGALGTTRYRIDVTPLGDVSAADRLGAESAAPPGWAPAAIAITARARSGRNLRLDTIGLIRDSAPAGLVR